MTREVGPYVGSRFIYSFSLVAFPFQFSSCESCSQQCFQGSVFELKEVKAEIKGKRCMLYRSRDCTHRGPNLLIAQMTTLLAAAMTPTPVNSQPSPMASMSGCATIAPVQEKIFRTKLLAATPADALLGINSVNIVVAIEKMSIEPMPKKKFAINGTSQNTPFSAVQPYQISAAGYKNAAIHAFSLMRSSGLYISFPFSSYLPAFLASLAIIKSVHLPPNMEDRM